MKTKHFICNTYTLGNKITADKIRHIYVNSYKQYMQQDKRDKYLLHPKVMRNTSSRKRLGSNWPDKPKEDFTYS